LHALTRRDRRSLSGQGLRGTLPASLAALRGLRLLCAPRASIEKCARVTWQCRRDLSYNALDGTMPSALLNLSTSLEVLALNNNRLAGPLPDWLGALSALRSLDLGVNALHGPLPAPDALRQLTALRTLSLHDNPLRATIPDAVGAMAALQLLELHYTRLQGTIPVALGRLSALTMLALQNNELMGDIPEVRRRDARFTAR
jgi:Leucine-rich repeat (LRR) protein